MKIKNQNILKSKIKDFKWPDKSTTSYDMFDFKNYIENL